MARKVLPKFMALALAMALAVTMIAVFALPASADAAPKEIKLWRSIGRFTPEERYAAVPYESDYGVLEKKFGVKFVFTDVPAESQNEQLNIMVSTDDLPDIVASWSHMDRSFLDPGLLYANRQIVALDEYAQYIPNYLKSIETYPAIGKSVKNEEGKLLAFCEPNIYLESAFSGGPMVRKDWLDKLGMPLPDTYKDWLSVFDAFKTKDPNGNGEADEVPYVGSQGTLRVLANTMGCPDDFFMVGGPTGTVAYGPIQPEYKERLLFLREIVEKGYINADYNNFKNETRDQLVANNQAGSTFTGTNNLDRWNLQARSTGNPDFLMWAVPYPKGPDGNRYFDRSMITKSITDGFYMISAKSKYPDVCAQLLDYFYTEEGILLTVFGVEGVTYTMADGFPVYTDLIRKNPDGLTPADAQLKYIGISGVPRMVDIRDVAQLVYSTPASRQAVVHNWTDVFDIKYNQPTPPALMADADSQEFSEIMADIKTYVDVSTEEFIQGKKSIENDLQAFQDEVKRLGIERALELKQNSVAQWQKRGGDYVYNMARAEINWSSLPMTADIGKEFADPALISAVAP